MRALVCYTNFVGGKTWSEVEFAAVEYCKIICRVVVSVMLEISNIRSQLHASLR